MIEDRARPSPLAGFFSLIVGGLVFVALIVVLDPVMRYEDCPNYLAAGDRSAFANPAWDGYLPLMTVVWLALVAGEQALPVTWRHRHWAFWVARASVAFGSALIASFFLVALLLTVCR